MKGIFELITDPLGLPIEWYWEYIILCIIGEVSYIMAWNIVGDLYSNGIISGRSIGSDLHWLIRLLWYVALWAITRLFIYVVKFIIANWQVILFGIGSVIGTVVICNIALIIMRKIKLRR